MRPEAPKVSVVIPTFQEEKYLGTSLSKLVKMEFPIEIIVVDGGSSDNTVSVARYFTSKVYRIKKRGISKARNYGAMKANGDLLVFLDADVIPPLDFVEKVIETFKDKKVVGATCRIMPAQPRFVEAIFFHFYNLLIRFCCNFKPHSRGEFIAVKMNDFLTINGFDENMSCLEDHDLAHRLAKKGRFVFIKNLTVYESLRRFRKLGIIKVVRTWLIDYLSVVTRGKPVSAVWQPIR